LTKIDEIKAQLVNSLPARLREDGAHLVDQATRLDDGAMTFDQLWKRLVADERVQNLIAEIGQPTHSDTIDARESQGPVMNPTGPVTQFFVNGNTDGLLESIRQANASAEQQNATAKLYMQQFPEALDRLVPAGEYYFPLTFRSISPDGASVEESASIEEAIGCVKIARLALLRGPAGSGKSTAMRRLADRLRQSDQMRVVPIYLQLRRLGSDIADRLRQAVKDENDPEEAIAPLLPSSIMPLSMEDLQRLGEYVASIEGGLILVIADGLNEVYGEEVTSLILQRLTMYVTLRGLQACALVTDRITPRDTINQQWQPMQLERLTRDVVHMQFHDRGMDALYDGLDEIDRSLLQTPYFLEYALKHNPTELHSPTNAIAGFFERLGIKDEELDQLAAAAFAVYTDHHSYQFDKAHFEKEVSQNTFQMLLDDGVVTIISPEVPDQADDQSGTQPTTDQAQFDHQLKHDYLAARYLSKHEDQWNPPVLDALSFEANSFDALALTLELLSDEGQADKFVERVHNWNWVAAFVCIAKAVRVGRGRHSQEMQMAVLALVAEKRFDPVQQMRKHADEVLAMFPPDTAAPYKQVGDINELCQLVQQQVLAERKYQDREPWFPKWRDLFIRFDGPQFNEQILKKLVDPMAVIGWTAANVFKRAKLSNTDVRQLRAYYDACYACDTNDWMASTVRWRVVHAVGATDTQPAVDLLFVALDQDNYIWARVAAARSLVEIAALTTNASLRRMVINTLMDRVEKAKDHTLANRTVREIGQSAFYRNARGDWETAITPLITLMQLRAPEQEWWSMLLDQFKVFCREQAESAALGKESRTV